MRNSDMSYIIFALKVYLNRLPQTDKVSLCIRMFGINHGQYLRYIEEF